MCFRAWGDRWGVKEPDFHTGQAPCILWGPRGPGGCPCISILSPVGCKSLSLKMKLEAAAGRSYIYSRSKCKMPPCPSDKAAPRTSHKDYPVILLYGVCQGQRKGHFMRGNTILPPPFSQQPSPSLPPCHTHAGISCKPKELLDSSPPQDGSPAVPSCIGFPCRLRLLSGCELHHSSKQKMVQGG